jgi:sugar lactone lactonase YvrE
MSSRDLRVVVEGLAFAEGPRWHEDRLWFSDMHDHRVVALNPDDTLTTIVEVPNQPSGLGWLPDGRLLVVSMTDRRLLRLDDDGQLVPAADLAELAAWHCNDMVVRADGLAYVGNFGFDLYGDAEHRAADLLAVTPQGSVRVVADGLEFPNGAVITPDGLTLVLGESFAGRLTAFDVAPDGSLSGRREWAKLVDAVPDGICLDADGAIWVASPLGHQVLRVAEGGEVLDRVDTGDRHAYACMLGGDDRRTLFVCTARSSNPEKCRALRAGRIEAVDVDVSGAGWP